MVIDAFDGRTYLVPHRGMNTPVVRAELHEIEAHPDQLRVIADRVDLYRPAQDSDG